MAIESELAKSGLTVPTVIKGHCDSNKDIYSNYLIKKKYKSDLFTWLNSFLVTNKKLNEKDSKNFMKKFINLLKYLRSNEQLFISSSSSSIRSTSKPFSKK